MAIVVDYMDGNTHVIINDENTVKTKEEVNAILDKITELYARYFPEEETGRERRVFSENE